MNITVETVSYEADRNSIFVSFTVDGDPHVTDVWARALVTRRRLYDLASYDDAFVAILREQWHRLNGDAPTSGTPAEVAAGMDTNVDLVIPQTILDQVTTIVGGELAAAIAASESDDGQAV